MDKFDLYVTPLSDNGPAFPLVQPATGDNGAVVCYGMTLRDYFAAKVVQGLYARVNWSCSDVAARAYEQADAMLKARNK